MNNSPTSLFSQVDRFFIGALVLATGAAFVMMVIAVFAAVLLREVVEIGLPWLEEVARYLLIWSVFLGAAVLARQNDHIAIDAISSALPARAQTSIRVAVASLGILIAAYFAYLGWLFTARAYEQQQLSLTGYLPVWIGYLVIPVGLGLVAISYLLWLFALVSDRRP